MAFKDQISKKAWSILSKRGTPPHMKEIFREYPALAVSAVLMPSVGRFAVENENRRRTAEENSYIDALTGLWNYRAFDDEIGREIKTAVRRGKPLTLGLADFDYFKKLNDTRGHLTGDQALRDFGESLKVRSRSSDMAYRIGGDEFALIMPETDFNEGFMAANNYQDRLADIIRPYGLSLSIGLATYVPESEWHDSHPEKALCSAAALRGRADRALYEAKKTRGQSDRTGIYAFPEDSLAVV